ncbi:MAG TPA: hypothetical protein VK196_09325 [Magnetospirillum sp.]|nr:hypothetical protein [Magnetospirillum sp.]
MIAAVTKTIWFSYADLLWKMSLHSEWLFALFALVGSVLLSLVPFKIAAALGLEDKAGRWKLALWSPAVFLIIPTLSLDWYFIRDKRHLLQSEWLPQAEAMAGLAVALLVAGLAWGVIQTVVAEQKDAKKRQIAEENARKLREDAERRELLQVKAGLERQLRDGG